MITIKTSSKRTVFIRRVAFFCIGSSSILSQLTFADDDIQTIVVSAQSRMQMLRDVPISMQVISPKQITELGAINLSQLNGYIPSLSVEGSQPTQPNFSLRGISASDFGMGTDSPVGIYVDGVYAGKSGGSLMSFNDVQRIEVLKGPQGTLFGRNSAAGARANASKVVYDQGLKKGVVNG